jgi:hypothetical protein
VIAAAFTLAGGIPGLIRMGVAAVLAAALAYSIGHAAGASAGRAELQSEITSKALAAEKERVSDDAALSRLSDRDLCRRALRDGGMQDDLCAGL